MPNESLPELEGCNQLIRARRGLLLYNRFDIEVGRSLERYGEWAEAELSVLQQMVGPGDIVVDAGAHIGVHTVFFAKAVAGRGGSESGKVIAFEPQRVLLQLLCANAALNGLNNVYPYHAALAETANSVIVPLLDYNAPNNFGRLRLGGWKEGEKVRGMPLDELELPRLRLLKVDVEGQELDVLRGATSTIRRLNPIVFAENNSSENSASLISFLLEEQYNLYWHLNFYFQQDNFLGRTENIFGTAFDVNIIGVPKSYRANIQNFTPVTGPEDSWKAAVERSRAADRKKP